MYTKFSIICQLSIHTVLNIQPYVATREVNNLFVYASEIRYGYPKLYGRNTGSAVETRLMDLTGMNERWAGGKVS
jgi:hypothetical protein